MYKKWFNWVEYGHGWCNLCTNDWISTSLIGKPNISAFEKRYFADFSFKLFMVLFQIYLEEWSDTWFRRKKSAVLKICELYEN